MTVSTALLIIKKKENKTLTEGIKIHSHTHQRQWGRVRKEVAARGGQRQEYQVEAAAGSTKVRHRKALWQHCVRQGRSSRSQKRLKSYITQYVACKAFLATTRASGASPSPTTSRRTRKKPTQNPEKLASHVPRRLGMQPARHVGIQDCVLEI